MTFHGFRYAEVDRLAGRARLPTSLEAVVVHSDLRRTGRFACSDDLLNQLHRNVVWGLRGNFLDVPTDCPQRDERLGWTGDIAVFAPTAAFLYDVAGFLARLAGRPRPRAAGRRTGWCRSSCPTSSSTSTPDRSSRRPRPPRSGATPRCGCRGRSGRRTATGAVLDGPVPTRWPRTCAGSSRCSRRRACGTRASSSATGSTRTAPPDEPFEAKADNGVVATACLYRTARIVARGGRAARAATTTRPTSTRWPSGPARPSTSTTSQDDGTHHERLRRPSTPWRSSSACSTTTTGRRGRATGSPSSSPRTATASRTGFAGTPFVTDALTATGHLDDGLPAAAASASARPGSTR